MESVDWLRKDMGVYSVNGPTWDDDLETICEKGTATMCFMYGLGHKQPTSAKSREHWS